MYNVRIRKEKGEYIISLEDDKSKSYVPMQVSAIKTTRNDDLLILDSADLVFYITEGTRTLEKHTRAERDI